VAILEIPDAITVTGSLARGAQNVPFSTWVDPNLRDRLSSRALKLKKRPVYLIRLPVVVVVVVIVVVIVVIVVVTVVVIVIVVGDSHTLVFGFVLLAV